MLKEERSPSIQNYPTSYNKMWHQLGNVYYFFEDISPCYRTWDNFDASPFD